MAGKKTYVVVKNGVEIQRLNTLIAARKLAEEEGAEVFCDGLSIYKAVEEIVHVELLWLKSQSRLKWRRQRRRSIV